MAALLPLAADAQAQTQTQAQAQAKARFGYLSYDAVLKAMPEYADAQQSLDKLKAQYEAEAKRSEDEFNSKYEEFLDGQRTLATPILKKRQAELEEMLAKGVQFKQEAQRLLKQAEADIYAPLRKRLDAVLNKIGAERGYEFILNTDGNALPFVNPEAGEDVTEAALQEIGSPHPTSPRGGGR